uniref:Catechol O-methyltransferase n=1 Tax=Ditylum brightwellii TaxID=49249 RepID=A0A7S2ERK4_9STRA|mmetsp:Transcript_4548/g.6903  ORF Transcript_4548/g.6903 Transcript_4548/m.6903 type:complete len:346 (+) Transcript_4548:49-1086(+)
MKEHDNEEEEDPFACFDDGDDDDSDEEESSKKTHDDDEEKNKINQVKKRDADCGILSFHPNTESSLLIHVQNTITTSSSSSSQQVKNAIDQFCHERHWMMHVGPEKAKILEEELCYSIDLFLQQQQKKTMKMNHFICVELGTYCGYASLVLGDILKQYSNNNNNNSSKKEKVDFHLYTVEINPMYAQIATKMIQLANLQEYITVVNITINMDGITTDLIECLQHEITIREEARRFCSNDTESTMTTTTTTTSQINFLMIDHDKDRYKQDLILLEQSKMILRGTTVVADNVLFANIMDYVTYVQLLATKGIVTTITRVCKVEYSTDEDGEEDGVELTRFIMDPVVT